MAHSHKKRLHQCELDMIEGALAGALAADIRFENPHEVKGYLAHGCIKDDILSACLSQNFDTYVKLEAAHRTQQLPSPRSSVERRSNTVETGQEGGGNCPDSNDNAAPIIALDDVPYISIYCPKWDDYRPLFVSIRDGTDAYISDAIVTAYDLKIDQYKGRRAVLLAWHKTNTTERNSQTWCYVVPEKDLDAEVVLGKRCSKEDTEVAEAEEAADIQNSASAIRRQPCNTRSPPDQLVYCDSGESEPAHLHTEAPIWQDLSLAEQKDMMSIIGNLNHHSARSIVVGKRKSSQESYLRFQRKRPKRSSGWVSDVSSTSTDKRGSSNS